MIEIPILWQFLILLATHYVADYHVQTHWQAVNKSKNNLALLEHVASYTAVMAIVTVVMFGFNSQWFGFVWVNAIMHYGTDYATSRWSASWFRRAIDETCRALVFRQTYRREPNHYDLERLRCNPAHKWHNFFSVIGFDQLIHQATLAFLLWLIVA